MEEVNSTITKNGIESVVDSLFSYHPFVMTGSHCIELYVLSIAYEIETSTNPIPRWRSSTKVVILH